MEARELAADDLSVLLVDFALAARELAAELTAVLAVLSVSPSSAPILLKLNPLSLSLSQEAERRSRSKGPIDCRLSCPKRGVRTKILIGGYAIFLINM